MMGKQGSLSGPSKSLAWYVTTSTHWIIFTEIFLDEKITEQAQHRDALLHRRVGKTNTRVQGNNPFPFGMWTMCQILHVESDLLAGNGFRDKLLSRTESQKITKAAPVGINGLGGKLQVGLHLQPGSCKFHLCD